MHNEEVYRIHVDLKNGLIAESDNSIISLLLADIREEKKRNVFSLHKKEIWCGDGTNCHFACF